MHHEIKYELVHRVDNAAYPINSIGICKAIMENVVIAKALHWGVDFVKKCLIGAKERFGLF